MYICPQPMLVYYTVMNSLKVSEVISSILYSTIWQDSNRERTKGGTWIPPLRGLESGDKVSNGCR